MAAYDRDGRRLICLLSAKALSGPIKICEGNPMETNVFGNLMDWGQVLEKLDRLTGNRELDLHQEELIRLIRFNHNWRLREAAIEALAFVENPNIALAREVLGVIQRTDLYYDIRILATDGLEKTSARLAKNPVPDKEQVQAFFRSAQQDLNQLLGSPQPPIFHHAIKQCVTRLEDLAESV
jgi:hypothetical protein